MATRIDAYRRPFFAPEDELFRRCLKVTTAIGLVFVLAVLVVPIRQLAITRVEQLPKRFAKLIIEPAKPPAPAAAQKATVEQPPVVEKEPAKPEPRPAPPPRARRLEEAKPLPPDAGVAGRERAKTEVASTIERSRASLEKSLQGLSASLQTTTAEPPRPTGRRRSRSVASGRSDGQMADVRADLGRGSGADLGGSTVQGSLVAIGSLTAPSSASASSGDESSEASASGSAPGVYRSNASLLAVIQKYAAGIQYCYGNELKRDPGLAGKMVVALSVAASGEVLEATIVQNTVRSERLATCALSQIRQWKFPPIASGVTSFQTPFVFTPPN
jgi:TonB family protein